MSPILTPIRDLAFEVRLVLILFSLSPAALASWCQDRYPQVQRAVPIGWYGLVLLTVSCATFTILGATPVVHSRDRSLVGSIVAGLLLGGLAIAADASTLRGFRRLRRVTSTRAAPVVPRWSLSPSNGSLPATDQLRRLRARMRDVGLPALLAAAILEEIVYRQQLLELLRPLFATALGPALITTVFFGLIHVHFGLGSVVSKLLFGAAFTALVLSGTELLSLILAHAVFNTVAFVLMARSTGGRFSAV